MTDALGVSFITETGATATYARIREVEYLGDGSGNALISVDFYLSKSGYASGTMPLQNKNYNGVPTPTAGGLEDAFTFLETLSDFTGYTVNP